MWLINYYVRNSNMLVSQTTYSCTACNSQAEYNVEVDIPLESITLVKHAIACECGYFKERIHYPVSFHNWRVEKQILSSRMDGCLSYIESLNKELEEEPSDSIGISCIKEWIGKEKERLESYHKRDSDLGNTPIPDSLFECK